MITDAALTHTSMRPNRSNARRAPPRPARSLTSAADVSVSAPAAAHAAAACSSDSESRAINTRRAPRAARAMAVARPIPLDAPVTTTTLPLIRMGLPVPGPVAPNRYQGRQGPHGSALGRVRLSERSGHPRNRVETCSTMEVYPSWCWCFPHAGRRRELTGGWRVRTTPRGWAALLNDETRVKTSVPDQSSSCTQGLRGVSRDRLLLGPAGCLVVMQEDLFAVRFANRRRSVAMIRRGHRSARAVHLARASGDQLRAGRHAARSFPSFPCSPSAPRSEPPQIPCTPHPMGRRTAEIEALHDRLGAAQPGHRTEHELLKQLCGAAAHGAVQQIRVGRLQIGRPLDVPVQHPRREAGSERLDNLVDALRDFVGRVVRYAPRQMRVGHALSCPRARVERRGHLDRKA